MHAWVLLTILSVIVTWTIAIPPGQQNAISELIDLKNLGDIELFLELEDAHLTVPQIITKYGYPVEIHEITTTDGYILTAHRIPHGKNFSDSETARPVVWLQHRLLGDSSNWVINDEDKALAYVLANTGYDVWMGNARGSTYSKKHVSMSPRGAKFWDFSYHEMGVYDIPAAIDYVLKITGQENLFYIGHSMGTTMFFVAMAERPELNKKIRLMTALSPVAYSANMFSPLRLIAPFAGHLQWILKMLGQHEFLPASPLMDFLGATLCRSHQPLQEICSNVLFLIGGDNIDQLDKFKIPIILGHVPAGTSTRTVVHLAQGITTPHFRQYNFGAYKNLLKYGSVTPPKYETSKITAPVAFVWGQNDWLSSPVDIRRLAAELPNLQKNYRVKHDKYNHLDFLWAKDNDILLNNEVLEFMKTY